MFGIRSLEETVPARIWADGRPGTCSSGGAEREARTREGAVELDDELGGYGGGAAGHALFLEEVMKERTVVLG